MRLSEIVKRVEDTLVSATKVIIIDVKVACKAIADNHARREEVEKQEVKQ